MLRIVVMLNVLFTIKTVSWRKVASMMRNSVLVTDHSMVLRKRFRMRKWRVVNYLLPLMGNRAVMVRLKMMIGMFRVDNRLRMRL